MPLVMIGATSACTSELNEKWALAALPGDVEPAGKSTPGPSAVWLISPLALCPQYPHRISPVFFAVDESTMMPTITFSGKARDHARQSTNDREQA
jgi:hypothetical protein